MENLKLISLWLNNYFLCYIILYGNLNIKREPNSQLFYLECACNLLKLRVKQLSKEMNSVQKNRKK